MKILFATSAAPQKSPFWTGEKQPPLGLGSVMAVARQAGYTIHFIDNYLQPSRFIEEGYLQRNAIDFVGIYANTICYRDTLRMFYAIDDLRNKGLWNGKIIVGGPHTSVAIETIPAFVDYIVQGEGERAILDILDGKEDGRILRKERILGLDSLPFQPWDIFSKLQYDTTCEWMNMKPVFTMNTSRGCPFECTFCSVSSVWGRRYTCFSAERILAEVEYLMKAFGAKAIYFREDNFTLNRLRTEAFCEGLIAKGFNLQWACESRVATLCDEELVKLMSAAGCKAVYLGIESGSQRMLDLMHKGITVEEIEKCISLCKKYNINSYCSLITGIPGDTYEDYQATLRLMDKTKPHSYCFNVFVGIPGGVLYNQVIEDRLYEYIDDLGLLYLPGFDVKAEFFYEADSCNFVHHKFKLRTEFDRELLPVLRKRRLKNYLHKGAALWRWCVSILGKMVSSVIDLCRSS